MSFWASFDPLGPNPMGAPWPKHPHRKHGGNIPTIVDNRRHSNSVPHSFVACHSRRVHPTTNRSSAPGNGTCDSRSTRSVSGQIDWALLHTCDGTAPNGPIPDSRRPCNSGRCSCTMIGLYRDSPCPRRSNPPYSSTIWDSGCRDGWPCASSSWWSWKLKG